MQLGGLDRARYFVPTVICAYLALICLVLIVTSAFLVSLQNAVAVTAAGIFGLSLTAGLGAVFWKAQRRDLQYTRFATRAGASQNFAAVRDAALRARWRIVREDAPRQFEAAASVSLLDAGERIAVRFDGSDVLVASICDPSVGFSLVGRRHCAEHRELVRQAVSGLALAADGAGETPPRSE
jgi:hypothetical protein